MKFLTFVLGLSLTWSLSASAVEIECKIQYNSQRTQFSGVKTFEVEANSSTVASFGTYSLYISIADANNPGAGKNQSTLYTYLWAPRFNAFVAKSRAKSAQKPASIDFMDQETRESISVVCRQ